MSSTIYVDNLQPNLGSQVVIPQLKPLAGSVLQVLNSIENQAVASSTTSYAFVSGLVVNITPLYATSKILVNVAINNISSTTGTIAIARLLRDSTVLAGHTGSGIAAAQNAFVTAGGGGDSNGVFSTDSRKVSGGIISYLDSPATTSTLTYKVEFASALNGDTVYLNRWALNTDMGSSSSITVMEIAQ